MKKLPDDIIQAIIDDYVAGLGPKAIAEKYGILNNSVPRILRKNNVERNQLKRVDQPTQQVIIGRYTGGEASTSIAADLQLDGGTVCRILKRNGVALRPAEDNKRKYEIKQRFFETIDTQEKAYWLGFLYADGSLSSGKGYGIRLALHPKDRDVLEKLSTTIYGFIKIGEDSVCAYPEDGRYLYVDIYSKRMWKDLVEKGCPPRKSFIIKFPDETIVPKELLWHFVRGYFDGDGCLGLADRHKPVVDFSSSALFIRGLIPFLKSEGIQCNAMQFNKENPLSANVQLTSFENIKHFLSLLYKDATIFMDRKKASMEEFLSSLNMKTSKKSDKYNDPQNYNTTYIPTWKGKQLTSENIAPLSADEREEVAHFALDFFRQGGFPYPTRDADELLHDFTILKNADPNAIMKEEEGKKVLSTANQNGSAIFKHFSPHLFEVKEGNNLNRPSLLEAFNDDNLLLRVIKNRVGYNMQLNGNMLRQGLPNSKIAFKASLFNTMVAKFLYSHYAKEGDLIYDYSMGFGQRLTAALSLPYKVKYVGVDVWQKSVESNQAILDFYRSHLPGFDREAEIVLSGSETYCPEAYQGKVNLAFSSPPYFNLEHYNGESSQAYATGLYNDFINGWWRKTVSNIDKLLAPSGIFALNIKERLHKFNLGEDMIGVIKEHGFTLIDRYDMQLSRNLAFNNKQGVHKYEPIFVFIRS